LSDSETAYIGVDNYRANLKIEGSNFTRANYLKYQGGAMECPGCPNDCIKRIDPASETRKVSGIHQEVTGSMGPNLGNRNLEIMLESNVLCNLLGMDPVSLGFTVSFAMECFEAGLLGVDEVNGFDIRFGSRTVQLSAFKKAEDGDGFILRLHASTSQKETVRIWIPALGMDESLDVPGEAIRTYRLRTAPPSLVESGICED